MEDPFDCSVVTLDLAGLDCECPSETKAEKLSRGDAWERCDDELIDGRKGKSSWWRPWRKDDRPEVSQVFEIHRDISHAETTYELPGDDCITPISLDGGRCETPVEALRSRFGHPSRPVPQGLHVPFGTAEIIAPGAIPSPINAAPEAIDVIAAQRVPSCGSCGPCGNGITKSFSLDPDGRPERRMEANMTLVSAFDE
ncbi:unnamed protein product [Cladocopium goreaui]|uniref:Uncharacterized protein n=1 Tax=Cladocopium goreaui TaxID=2562237 RepID=A0A9P1GI72_9DINO|nr:unnamed protein product [Cladocopium goreaui]|mmetsp:Transcript_48233/g.105264  ORF Transcript_48233/g.105264 Transcript_48233/m.105264 type:complete len:198 (-) Transcript_48233:28-621(-)